MTLGMDILHPGLMFTDMMYAIHEGDWSQAFVLY